MLRLVQALHGLKDAHRTCSLESAVPPRSATASASIGCLKISTSARLITRSYSTCIVEATILAAPANSSAIRSAGSTRQLCIERGDLGLYIRKAVSLGPVRFNLSKSGIGISAGVRGLRWGASPRGNYVHMGRHGLYFRQSLPSAGRTARPTPVETPAAVSSGTVGEFQEIDSGDILQMQDSSSSDLLRELNEKRSRARLAPWVFVAGILLAVLVPPLGLLISVAGTWLAWTWDRMRRTTVVLYDLEQEVAETYGRLHAVFDELQGCGGKWHISARAGVHDQKYHAGAGALIKRHAVSLKAGQPPLMKVNLDVPLLPVGKQTLAFFPDRLLVFDHRGVGAINYTGLKVESADSRFIEEGSVPTDATIVGRTWRYVNKKGGPDKRFKDNRELPVCAYTAVAFTSESGLNELVQFSKRSAAGPLLEALDGMRQLSVTEGHVLADVAG